MKKLLIFMLSAISFCSCAKCIDWVPVTFQIIVQDEQGKYLLDPTNDNTWYKHIQLNYSRCNNHSDYS